MEAEIIQNWEFNNYKILKAGEREQLEQEFGARNGLYDLLKEKLRHQRSYIDTFFHDRVCSDNLCREVKKKGMCGNIHIEYTLEKLVGIRDNIKNILLSTSSGKYHRFVNEVLEINKNKKVEEFKKNLDKVNADSKVYLFIGKTKSGKSTVINCLTGKRPQLIKDSNGQGVYITFEEKDALKVGGDGLSCTEIPELVQGFLGEENTFVCDTAGFGDNTEGQACLKSALCLHLLMKKVKKITLVYLIDGRLLSSVQDKIDLRDDYNLLSGMLQEPAKLDKRVFFLFNKATEGPNSNYEKFLALPRSANFKKYNSETQNFYRFFEKQNNLFPLFLYDSAETSSNIVTVSEKLKVSSYFKSGEVKAMLTGIDLEPVEKFYIVNGPKMLKNKLKSMLKKHLMKVNKNEELKNIEQNLGDDLILSKEKIKEFTNSFYYFLELLNQIIEIVEKPIELRDNAKKNPKYEDLLTSLCALKFESQEDKAELIVVLGCLKISSKLVNEKNLIEERDLLDQYVTLPLSEILEKWTFQYAIRLKQISWKFISKAICTASSTIFDDLKKMKEKKSPPEEYKQEITKLNENFKKFEVRHLKFDSKDERVEIICNTIKILPTLDAFFIKLGKIDIFKNLLNEIENCHQNNVAILNCLIDSENLETIENRKKETLILLKNQNKQVIGRSLSGVVISNLFKSPKLIRKGLKETIRKAALQGTLKSCAKYMPIAGGIISFLDIIKERESLTKRQIAVKSVAASFCFIPGWVAVGTSVSLDIISEIMPWYSDDSELLLEKFQFYFMRNRKNDKTNSLKDKIFESTEGRENSKVVLSIDGGGNFINALVPCMILSHLIDEIYQDEMIDIKLFDYYAGHSTGALILSLLEAEFNMNKVDGSLVFMILSKNYNYIYKPSIKKKTPVIENDITYSDIKLKKFLSVFFQNKKFSEKKIPTMIIAYDEGTTILESNGVNHKFKCSYDENQKTSLMTDILIDSLSTYKGFIGHRSMEAPSSKEFRNPSSLAFNQAKNIFKTPNVYVVSIGNGFRDDYISAENRDPELINNENYFRFEPNINWRYDKDGFPILDLKEFEDVFKTVQSYLVASQTNKKCVQSLKALLKKKIKY